jgi:hypothetical protein
MLSSDWHMLLGLVIGTVVLLSVVIVFGLRFATRRQAQVLRDTNASAVLAEAGLSESNRLGLLYGIWQTTMGEVILHVRDGNDAEIARVVHRVVGADITLGEEHYAVVITSGWNESAALMRGSDRTGESVPLCTFERRGWASPVACYTLPDASVLSIRTRWNLSWKPKPLAILQNNQRIGQLFALGGSTFNDGRALILPSSIALPIRIFILYKALGSTSSNCGGHAG